MSRWIFLRPLKLLLFTLRSLTFNTKTSRAVILDTAFEPVFCLIDKFVGVLGPVGVVIMITTEKQREVHDSVTRPD